MVMVNSYNHSLLCLGCHQVKSAGGWMGRQGKVFWTSQLSEGNDKWEGKAKPQASLNPGLAGKVACIFL